MTPDYMQMHPVFRPVDIHLQHPDFSLNAHDMIVVYPFSFLGETDSTFYMIALRRKEAEGYSEIAECETEESALYHAECFKRLLGMDYVYDPTPPKLGM